MYDVHPSAGAVLHPWREPANSPSTPSTSTLNILGIYLLHLVLGWKMQWNDGMEYGMEQ